MKRLTMITAMLALLVAAGCKEEPPEPEVSAQSPVASQPATSPPPTTTTLPAEAPDVATMPQSPDDIERITLDDVIELRAEDQVVIVDVRSSQYYIAGHIPGAINIPAGQAREMADMLPKGKKIVTYCT